MQAPIPELPLKKMYLLPKLHELLGGLGNSIIFLKCHGTCLEELLPGTESIRQKQLSIISFQNEPIFCQDTLYDGFQKS